MQLKIDDLVLVYHQTEYKTAIAKIVHISVPDSLIQVKLITHYPEFNHFINVKHWLSKERVKPFKPTIEELFKIRKAINESSEPPF